MSWYSANTLCTQVNDAGRAFLSGYQIPLESLAIVEIIDGRISIVESVASHMEEESSPAVANLFQDQSDSEVYTDMDPM